MKLFINNIMGKAGGQVTRIRSLNLTDPELRRCVTVFCSSIDLTLGPDIIQKEVKIPFIPEFFVSILFEFFFIPFVLKKHNIRQNLYINLSNFSLPIACKCQKILGVSNALIFDNSQNSKVVKYWILYILFHLSQYFIDKNVFLSMHCLKMANASPFKLKPSVVIHNGVSEFWYKRKWSRNLENSQKLKLLYVSHGYYYKNHRFLLNYINKLKASIDIGIELNLVGHFKADIKKSLENHANLIGIRDNVKFHAQCDRYEIRNLLLSSTFVIYPSDVENCPNALLEASASGITCIVPNKQPYIEFNRSNFIYFEPLNIESAVRCTVDRFKSEKVSLQETRKDHVNLTWSDFWNNIVSEGLK